MRLILLALLLAMPGLGADLWPFGGGSGNASKIRGVTVKASLGCSDGQALVYVAANTQFECVATSGSGDVLGGTNLTTTGAIPYVSASGTLNQDAALTWDATNNRVLVGTETGSTNSNARMAVVGTSNPYTLALKTAGSGINFYLGMDTSALGLTFSNNAGTAIGRVLDGGSWGIGPSNTSPTGTLHVYDATATTGVTTLTVRAGLGQSSTSLQEWKTAAGSLVAAMSPTGVFSPAQIVLGAQFNIYQSTGGIIQMASANELRWQSTTSIFSGSPDLGIVRNAAGVAALTNGSSTNYWLMGSNGILPGADNTYDIGSTAASVRSVYADTDFIGTTTSFFYWGPTGSDGSWRMGLDSGSMVIQKRESGSWVTKSTLAP